MARFRSRRALRRPGPKKPRVAEHAFDPDDAIPPDFYGRRSCRDCGKTGQVGDTQHPQGALPLALAVRPPTPPGVAELEARRLGEPL